jgi:hypothetical protein
MTAVPRLPARPIRRRALLVVAVLAAATVAVLLVSQTAWPSPDGRATADALDQASRIARAGSLLASTYSGGETPSNAEVADKIATGTGIPGVNMRSVLAKSVQNPDRHGVGTLATVDVVLTGETSAGFNTAHKLQVCVRFTVVREQTGPRDVHYEQIRCPPGTAPVR